MSPAATELLERFVRSGKYAALRPAPLRLYVYLVVRYEPGRRFQALLGQLAVGAGLSCKHAGHALRTLEAAGFVARVHDELDAGPWYALTLPPPPPTPPYHTQPDKKSD